jgi:hypothetical protein
MVYCECGNEVSPARVKLVGKICLECGEKQAQKLASVRRKQLAPAYNKGAYQYITENDLLDIGR